MRKNVRHIMLSLWVGWCTYWKMELSGVIFFEGLVVRYLVEPVIFRFHRKPKQNLGSETELSVSTYF